MFAEFPPSSIDTGVRLGAAAVTMALPVAARRWRLDDGTHLPRSGRRPWASGAAQVTLPRVV
jgi:hypothetical protein